MNDEKHIRVYICEDDELAKHLTYFFGKGISFVASFKASSRDDITDALDAVMESENGHYPQEHKH